MGNTKNNFDDEKTNEDKQEESNPLLTREAEENNDKENLYVPQEVPASTAPTAEAYGWTADGLPLGHGSVMGEPIGRAEWDSSLFACLGRNDEFCSSDLEVCLLGSLAPCVLYGSNVERLGSGPGTFSNHCLPYSGLYLIGQSLFGWNCVAPWFSYPTRTALRHRFNLEGSCETVNSTCGCCGSCMDDEMQREQCETTCDFVTHVLCHSCALCQEGRELRRRLPHPGFNAQPVLVMIPPHGQTMDRTP